jgi:hypothetical protein
MIDGAHFRASPAELVKTALQARSEVRYLPFVFLIPLVVRAVPEVLMGPYIVGFDPMAYYVPSVYSWIRHDVDLWSFLAEVPLLYCILAPPTLLGFDIVFVLKVVGPLLHGSLALAAYGFARRALGWSPGKGFFATLLVTLYFVALRVSWDLLRTELALIFLFMTLTMLQRGFGGWKNLVLLPLAMILVALSHELVTVIMFVVVAAMVLRSLFERGYVEARSLVLASLPATLLFLFVFYAKCRVSSGEFLTKLISFPGKESEGWLSLFGFSSYQDMAVNMLGFLLYCHLLLMPLAVRGARFLKNLQIRSWTLWSLGAILSPVVSQSAEFGGYRWTLMLTYPLSFYAVEALANARLDRRRLLLLVTIGVFTVGFVTMPYEYGFPYFAIPQYRVYIPSSMLQNTVPLSDCRDTVSVLQWLKNGMDGDARLLTHRVFYGWALLTLDEDQVIHYEYGNPEEAAREVAQRGCDKIYLIWWVNGFGWHGQPTISSSFKEVWRSGRIAAYIYEETP